MGFVVSSASCCMINNGHNQENRTVRKANKCDGIEWDRALVMGTRWFRLMSGYQNTDNMKMECCQSRESVKEQRSVPVHSQVRKIKQESEKILDWSPGNPEIRPLFREINRQISRSPLGISGRPISVGDF
ncbi:hypothetical protein VNO77_00032 [Canavalia gladiata]|uniref:Uncharacterized protein n=1 Tax=Canavalia gladiata TaxID=3824 RepID=A0AAN9MPC0_CANGL